MKATYSNSVFINCPFSADFDPMFRAMVFAVIDCGFVPRSAREEIDSGTVRLQKIESIIENSKFSINDLSNMSLDSKHHLPRFNMPLELGLFLGAKRFGSDEQRKKRLIIMDSHPHRYQIAISDISGQDIECHESEPEKAIKSVRNWLNTVSRRTTIPGASFVINRYKRFESELPAICQVLRYDPEDLPFNDYCETVTEWQKQYTETDSGN